MTAPSDSSAPPPHKGRGAVSNLEGRFESIRHEAVDDGWGSNDEPPPNPRTELRVDAARRIIARNESPDIPFTQSINPYRGCEHGCIYCYARPTHSYLGLSPGLDFETRLFYKPEAARLLDAELRRPGHRADPICLGANTDAYQPAERRLSITRAVIEVLSRFRHPLYIVTKSALVERDLDLLAPMAEMGLAQVFFSVTTFDAALKRDLEPRAASAGRRLAAMRSLSEAGIPTGVLVAPVIPALTDSEMERILTAAREHGAASAGYTLLRLPHEVAPLFREWLATHYPGKAAHVMSLIRQSRGGRDYQSEFGTRMRGSGLFAAMIEKRFALACRKLGFDTTRGGLETRHFRVPPAAGEQLGLFE